MLCQGEHRRNIGPEVRPDGVRFQHTVLFDGVDCNGNAWLEALHVLSEVFSPAFDAAAVVPDLQNENAPMLYTNSDDLPQDIFIVSGLSDSGCGDAANRVISVVPAELLDADLHTTFPPPYTLEIQ